MTVILAYLTAYWPLLVATTALALCMWALWRTTERRDVQVWVGEDYMRPTVLLLLALPTLANAPTAPDELSTRQYMIRPTCTPYQRGAVSWYGPRFHGRLAADGRPFNAYAPSCAHRTLPLGSLVRVTVNGSVAYLRVTDRGPYVRGRVLDVSRAAAKQLHMRDAGVVRGRIEVCG